MALSYIAVLTNTFKLQLCHHDTAFYFFCENKLLGEHYVLTCSYIDLTDDKYSNGGQCGRAHQ